MSDESFLSDKLIVSKAYDTVELSQRWHKACFLGFLNEHEAQLIKDNIHHFEGSAFWGGYEDAQRVMFASGVTDVTDFPITPLKFTYKSEYRLTHRDFLGALMSLGIERSVVGDILTFDGFTVVFIKDDMVTFVMNEVSKIGRVGVKIEECDFCEIHYESVFDELTFTLSSLRLDVFVSALCCVSRDKAQQQIKADTVSVNHKIENSCSKTLKAGDVITIRKYGKFVFTEENGFSKKGRIRVTVKHFR